MIEKVSYDYFYEILHKVFCIGHSCYRCKMNMGWECRIVCEDRAKLYEEFFGNKLCTVGDYSGKD